jgi:hypothetical protein
MRLSILLLGLALIACDGVSPPPPGALSGTWVWHASIAGTNTTMNLVDSSGQVSGSGEADIEAGLPRDFTVSGTLQRDQLSLSIAFDAGTQATYSATFSNDTLDGTWTEGGNASARVFVRGP